MGRGVSDMAIVVMTCDAYHDAWVPFYTLMDRYWPDRNYRIYHVTDNGKHGFCEWIGLEEATSIDTTYTGDLPWTERLLAALFKIPEKYILLLLEDYFITKPVDSDGIELARKVLRYHDGALIRLFPAPGATKELLVGNHKDIIGEIQKTDPYSISTQATIWNKTSLQYVLSRNPNMNIWSFENKGSLDIKTSEYNRLFLGYFEGTDYPIDYYCTAIAKGEWMPEAVELCKREGIKVDLNYRKIKTT